MFDYWSELVGVDINVIGVWLSLLNGFKVLFDKSMVMSRKLTILSIDDISFSNPSNLL